MNNLSSIKNIGTEFTSFAEFIDITKTKIEASGVALKYKNPIGFVGSAPITFDSIKLAYKGIVLLDIPGEWNFRWECTGANATAEEFTVQVLPSKV